MFGGDGLLPKGLKLLLGQRDGVGQQLFKKSPALAEAVSLVLALLLFLLLDKPYVWLMVLSDSCLLYLTFCQSGIYHTGC